MFQLPSIGFPPSRENKKKSMINLSLHCDYQCLDGFKFGSADTLYDPERRTFEACFTLV